jgi:hypothetical protein
MCCPIAAKFIRVPWFSTYAERMSRASTRERPKQGHMSLRYGRQQQLVEQFVSTLVA